MFNAMKRIGLMLYGIILFVMFFCSNNIAAQETTETSSSLPVKLEELTTPDFILAVEKAKKVCLIPIGVMEKHGAHLPLGTDLMGIREIALRAAKEEYCIVYPEYYFSQVLGGKHQPGTIAYSSELIWNVLQETCDELARNGIKKIILVNGHGGNNSFLNFFCRSQMDKRRDYSVVSFIGYSEGWMDLVEKVEPYRKTAATGHACEVETSIIEAVRPDLVHTERAETQSGENLKRLDHIPYIYTGLSFYASYPNFYVGDASYSDPRIGEIMINSAADRLVEVIRILKTDDTIEELQNQFYDESENPLKTKQ
jgi:creatinine amidohydrolase